MSGFTLLWEKLLMSSIWIRGSKETRLVWITLLAKKDKNGIVTGSVIGLADVAKVSPEECREALKVLTSPDPEDTSKVDEGRRIREIPGGWQVVNHDLYRFSTEARRQFWRESQALQRAKVKESKSSKKKQKGKPLPGEQEYVKAHGDGASEPELNKIVDKYQPKSYGN